MLTFHLEAPAIAAPGLDGWNTAVPVLSGKLPFRAAALPDYAPEILPSITLRRSSASVRLVAQVAQEARAASVFKPEAMTAVFASSSGDTEILDYLCRELATEAPMVSPIRFHNSVHNAPAGHWSIAMGSMQPTSTLAAYDASFTAGLLSAAAQCTTEARPVMLAAYDLPYQEPLNGVRPLAGPFATAMILSPKKTVRSLLWCRLAICDGDISATILDTPALEALRMNNPAARALPLLECLAAPRRRDIRLEYLDGTGLLIECTPC